MKLKTNSKGKNEISQAMGTRNGSLKDKGCVEKQKEKKRKNEVERTNKGRN